MSRSSAARWVFLMFVLLSGCALVITSCQKAGTNVEDMYTITATAGDNGTIDPSGAVKVKYGGDQQFSVSPDPGYKIEDVAVDGAFVGQVEEYLFTKVVEDHSITASFIEKTASDLIVEGWQAFAGRNYRLAGSLFAGALGKDSTIIDAYLGAGWSHARLNDLTTAALDFNTGLGRSSTNLDLNAGLAFVFNAQKLYAQSENLALNVIQVNPGWSFSRDTSVSTSDLHLLLAQDYFAEARYDLSLQQVKILNPSFIITDVSTVSGQTALAQEIERLRAIA